MPWVIGEQVGDKGSILAFQGSDAGNICIDSEVLMKLEEIYRKLAILPLHWESASLGPQRAGERQRCYFFSIVGVG